MCNYNISVDNSIVDRIRPAFKDDNAINDWMQGLVVELMTQKAQSLEGENQLKQMSMAEYCEHIPLEDAFSRLREEIHQEYQPRA